MHYFDTIINYTEIELKVCAEITHGGGWYEHSVKNDYDIWIITEGEIEVEAYGEKTRLRQGDLYFLYPDIEYRAACTSSGCRMIYTHFDFKVGLNNRALDTYRLQGKFAGEDIKAELGLFISAFLLYQKKEPLSFFSIKGYFIVLLGWLIKLRINEHALSYGAKNVARLQGVFEYASKNLDRPISNKELADIMFLSVKHFNYVFKSILGIPPAKYVAQLRLGKALEMLCEGQYSIKDIAAKLGFSDQHAFSKAFKKRYNISPSAAIKKL